MQKNEWTFPSADGITRIHAVEWLPEGEAQAVVQIAHGVAEYIDRYEPLAAYLTERGIAVTGNDHIGHGQSLAEGAHRLWFGPGESWDFAVDDLYALRDEAGKKFPGVPVFLLGHSMGSFMARTYLIRYPGTVSGAILMGTGQMPSALVAAGLAVAGAQIARVGEDGTSALVDKLAFGSYNKLFTPNRTDYDWLSVNRENVDAYIADPLCGGSVSVGLFREMLRGIRFIAKPANLAKMNMDTPVLFVSGSMDPVGDCGKGVQRALRSFQRAGVRNASLRLYPGARHEILNDDCQETVCRDLFDWVCAQLPAPVA